MVRKSDWEIRHFRPPDRLVDVETGEDSGIFLDGRKDFALEQGGMAPGKLEISDINKAIDALVEAFNRYQISDDYVKGKLSELTDRLFPSKPSLPTVAPELYADRQDRKENPVDFIKRVYGPYIGNGLDRPTLLHLDKQLYHGLNQWRIKHGLPEGLDLPTKSDLVTKELETLGHEAIRTGRRLASAARHR